MALQVPLTLSSGSRLTALGSYVPHRVIANEEIEASLKLPDGWIHQRTGIRARRYAAPDEQTSDLCVFAAKHLSERSGVDLEDVDLVIAGGMSPDYLVPGTACLVQHKLGLLKAAAFDIEAACASFVHALQVADALVRAQSYRKVLVVCGDVMSRLLDPSDRGTVAVFGDGAGAALIETDESRMMLAQGAGSDGSGAALIFRYDPSGINANGSGACDLHMKGSEVYRWVLDTLPHKVNEIVTASGYSMTDIDWFVPHSANARMLEALCSRIGFPSERMLTSIDCYGNTGAASIPLSLIQGLESGSLKEGDKVLLFGFGAGLSYAGCLIQWGVAAPGRNLND